MNIEKMSTCPASEDMCMAKMSTVPSSFSLFVVKALKCTQTRTVIKRIEALVSEPGCPHQSSAWAIVSDFRGTVLRYDEPTEPVGAED